jgi:hypothetical protein
MRRLLVAIVLLAVWPAVPASAFQPGDPLVPRQWYLTADRPFELWPVVPPLAPVRVAIVDSGIDASHPEFAGRIAAAKSFVGRSVKDADGHGTFVAGEIGAALGNDQGIAGIAFPAELLVAKVLKRDGTIDPRDEAAAIRWALSQGARVINLSFGGVRDPSNRHLDAFSPVERAAVAEATRRGAVVVAAVGNADQSPRSPWPYASYPAALPHVLGVGAYARDGSIPPFSNRDEVFNDLVAPGTEMFSTLPRPLTARYPSCVEQGYSDCGSPEYRNAGGTSFAAPQVAAAAALLLAVRPDLQPSQVATILERSAVDAVPADGCPRCPIGRDALSGWGKLDITAALEALSGPLPAPDHAEPNDDAGSHAATLTGRAVELAPTLDFWDDPLDVYRVRLRKGQWLYARVAGPDGARTSLALWRPGTASVVGPKTRRLAFSRRAGTAQRLLFQARRDGWHFVEVRLDAPGAGAYDLHVEQAP